MRDAEELPTEKLQKVLANAGQGSRREMERVITAGRVEVNGELATLGDRVTSEDKIRIDGRPLRLSEEQHPTEILLYNKPEGEICSRKDPKGRPTVYDKLPRLPGQRWISIGRLDFNTSGLLLFTNNGELANLLTHPSSNIDREYLVRVQGDVDAAMLTRLKEGVMLEDGMAKFNDVVDAPQQKEDHKGANRWFYVCLMEGRNREVRRLWESQNIRVSRLKRVRFGDIFMPSHVRSGQFEKMDRKIVDSLCVRVGLEKLSGKTSLNDKQQAARHQKRLRSAGPQRSKKRR